MAKKVSVFGVMLAVAMVFSYIEFLFPLDFIAPGVKLGLANAVTLLFLLLGSKSTAAAVSLCRVLLSALLFGNLMGLIYSFSGAVLSFAVMLFFLKIKAFGIMGISIMGGIFHNIGQCIVAFAVLQNAGVFFYLPVLLASGALCGALIGFCAGKLFENKNISKLIKK